MPSYNNAVPFDASPRSLPYIEPLALKIRRAPFDNPDWLFDLKHDGLRGALCLKLRIYRSSTLSAYHILLLAAAGSCLVRTLACPQVSRRPPRQFHALEKRAFSIALRVLTKGEALLDQTQDAFVSERRLGSRVLRHWDAAAVGRGFPATANIDPWLVAEDWANCVLVRVGSELADATFIVVGENLAPASEHRLDGLSILACARNTLLGALLKELWRVHESRRPVMVEGTTEHLGGQILYRGVLMPLSADGLTIDTILGAANYRPLRTDIPL